MRVLWLQRKVNVVGVGVGVNRGMAEGKRRSVRSLSGTVGKKVMNIKLFLGSWEWCVPSH